MPQRLHDEIALAFGQRLKELRTRAGVSQETLADAAGMHRDAIYKIEHGKRSPRVDSLILIAAALGVDPVELVKGLKG